MKEASAIDIQATARVPAKPMRRASMRVGVTVFVIVIGVAAGSYYWLVTPPSIEKLATLGVLENLQTAIDFSTEDPSNWVLRPTVAEDKTPEEYQRWLREVLQEEISKEGLAVLAKDAQFGPLLSLFPDQAVAWTSPHSIPPEACLAYRMERAGITAEVVLAPHQGSFKIIRCNNIKQMALLPKP